MSAKHVNMTLMGFVSAKVRCYPSNPVLIACRDKAKLSLNIVDKTGFKLLQSVHTVHTGDQVNK